MGFREGIGDTISPHCQLTASKNVDCEQRNQPRVPPDQRIPFATDADYDECRRLHRKFGTTYYFASQKFRPETRNQVHALYGFVRVPDEWVDNPSTANPREQLQEFRRQLVTGYEGVRPDEPVLRAFVDVCHACQMPLDEPLCFLDAMEQDLDKTRYNTYAELEHYMRGSAAAVGVMMCHILGVGADKEAIRGAVALGEAMQLTNFLRDVGEDTQRGRIYLPLEDMSSFHVSEDDILQGKMSDHFVGLMKFQIERARNLYREAETTISLLPPEGRKPVKLALKLYERILNRIEERGYDVFGGRARTSKIEKLSVAAQVMLGLA
jgi:15-cis-phytoene synthase